MIAMQFPDNKSICTSKLTEEECLLERNIFDDDQNTCYWYLSHHAAEVDMYSCGYKEVELTAWGLCWMVMFVSCLVLPANFLLDCFFGRYILIPVEKTESGYRKSTRQAFFSIFNKKNSNVASTPPIENDTNIEGVDLHINEGGDDRGRDIENNQLDFANFLMADLILKIKLQRLNIAISDTQRYDENWRWNADIGNFENCNWFRQKVSSLKNLKVVNEPPLVEFENSVAPFQNSNYIRTRKEVLDTISIADTLKSNILKDADSMKIARVLFHIFLMDYMGRKNSAARVFAARHDDMFHSAKAISLVHKTLAILCMVLVNIIFLYYVLVNNGDREVSYQTSFLIFYVLQFVIEFVWYEAMICIWMFYAVPYTICREVQAALATLRESASQAFLRPIDIGDNVLNASKFFFVSTKLAETFPHLLESQAVLAHRTVFRPIDNTALVKSLQQDNKDFYYSFSITSRLCALLRLIGALPRVYKRSSLYMLQLLAAFCIFGTALLVQQSALWAIVVAALLLYEGIMRLVFVSWNNVVHVEETVLPHDIDKELEDDDVDAQNEEKNNELDSTNDANQYANLIVMGQQNAGVFTTPSFSMIIKDDERNRKVHDEEIAFKDSQIRNVDRAFGERSALAYSYSIINPDTPIVSYTPSIVSNTFAHQKKKLQPPRKILADIFELSSESSSEEDAVRLNETTARNIPHNTRHMRNKVFPTRNSIVNPKTPTVAFSPSIASSLAFQQQPKKRMVHLPKKIIPDVFELSSSSGSEEEQGKAVDKFLVHNGVIHEEYQHDADDDDDDEEEDDVNVDLVRSFNSTVLNAFRDDEEDKDLHEAETTKDENNNENDNNNDNDGNDDDDDDDDRETEGYTMLMETFNLQINANDSDGDSEGQ